MLLILTFLALILILVLGFLTTVANGRKVAQSAVVSARAQQLADAAVQIVMGQIRQGTSTPSGYSPTTTTWASQPGMIRTFNNQGAELTNYKLYSSQAMTTTGGLSVATTAAALANNVNDFDPHWYNQSSLWTDINAPVYDVTGTLNYPIFDPTGVGATPQIPNSTIVGGAPPTPTGILGLSVAGAPTGVDPVSGVTNPAPMPVQWLYMLRDGTLAVATPTGAGNSVTVAGASAANPIVSRVAFWTDDETCKVNINTACGDLWNPGPFTGFITPNAPIANPPLQNPGAFWDTPRCSTTFEHNIIASVQPAQNEYQRYPGLASTVYLTAVLPGITDRNSLFNLMPRVGATGSSFGGSVFPTGGVTVTSAGGTSNSVNLNDQRLYASVDELLFNPNYTGSARGPNTGLISGAQLEQARFCLTAHSTAPEVNLFGQPRVAIWPIHADVVAKEGTSVLSAYGTVYDQLMGFCSHLGAAGNGNDYIFARGSTNKTTNSKSSTSVTTDYLGNTRNPLLYGYLENMTSQAVPGFGGNFLSKYGNDRDQILTEMYDYMRATNLDDKSVVQASRYTQTGARGGGYVSPIQITSPKGISTMGFGRAFTISEIGIHFICNADGGGTAQLPGGTAPYNTPPANASFPYSGSGPTTDDYQKESNQAASRMMGLAGKTTLSPTQKLIQPILLLQTFCPSEGYLYVQPYYQIVASGLDSIAINGISLGMGDNLPCMMATDDTIASNFQRPWGGNLNFRSQLAGNYLPFDTTSNGNNPVAHPDATKANSWYPFVGKPFLFDSSTSPAGAKMKFTAGTITLKIYSILPSNPIISGSPPSTYLLQTITVDMSKLNDNLPVPNLVTTGFPGVMPSECFWSLGVDGPFSSGNGTQGRLAFECQYPFTSGSYIRGSDSATPYPNPTTLPDPGTGNNAHYDVVRDMVPGYPSATNPVGAQDDTRLIAALPSVPASLWVPQRNSIPGSSYWIGASFGSCNGSQIASCPGADLQGRLVDIPPLTLPYNLFGGDFVNTYGVPTVAAPPGFLADGTTSTALAPQVTGDFDTGVSCSPDGAYINKPDEGDMKDIGQTAGGADAPYFDNSWNVVSDPSYFSPNRTLPSPGMFGSLPTGVYRTGQGTLGLGWQTLLFRPGLQSNGKPHPNAGIPLAGPPYTTLPDYLWMDLFWMPTIQPYAVSTPMATAGKINLNYQLAPFTYINRSTAMIAAMKAQKLLCLSQTSIHPYHMQNCSDPGWAGTLSNNDRVDLNLTDTGGSLTEFVNKFASGDIFRSATQICDIDLVPIGQSWTGATSAIQTQAAAFWNANALTGDNCRERPYANLYEVLTTKSNSYMVHFRVQALQKVPGTPVTQWIEGTDVVNSEYRGSSLIERYLDLADPKNPVPDFTSATLPVTASTPTLETHYKYHIISTKRFNP